MISLRFGSNSSWSQRKPIYQKYLFNLIEANFIMTSPIMHCLLTLIKCVNIFSSYASSKIGDAGPMYISTKKFTIRYIIINITNNCGAVIAG